MNIRSFLTVLALGGCVFAPAQEIVKTNAQNMH